jgi:hypothetical protein
MMIDVWDPPYRCEVVHLGNVVTGRGIFEVTAREDGHSRFSWHEVLDSRGVRRLVDQAGVLPTRATLAFALRRLAKLVAAEADGVGPEQGRAA